MSADEKLQLILDNNFSDRELLVIRPETQSVPLVAAKVYKSTRSFSIGQLIYIYDVYWGMNDKAKIVGRFRRKQKWVRGVIPIKNLGDFRVKVVYEPAVINKLQGERITRHLYARFLSGRKSQTDNKSITEGLLNWLKRIVGSVKRA